MKKLGWLGLAVILGIGFSGAFGVTAQAEGGAKSQPLPDFSEDFEGYDIGKIEEMSSFQENWSNDYFRGATETAGQQANVATVEYENGTDGNKVLHVKNIEGDGSFFFISAGKASLYKNFNITFKAKVTNAKENLGGWFGINCRKEADSRYNATNGMLLTYRWYSDSTAISPATYRYMPGAQVELSPSIIEENGIKYSQYTTYESYEAGENVFDWIEYKISVSETSYKMYANDLLVADFTCDRNALDIFGYVSFNVCVCDMLMDDFYLENLDEEAPPIDETEEESSTEEVAPPQKESASESNNEASKEETGCGSMLSSVGVSAGLMLWGAVAFIRRKR